MQGMWEPCHKPEDILGAAFLCNSEETVQEIYKKLLEKYPMAKSHLKNIMNVISRQHTWSGVLFTYVRSQYTVKLVQ